jgi:diguanylate cyclase (GGDEF)-like protein
MGTELADPAMDLLTAQIADIWLASRSGWRVPPLSPVLRAAFERDTRRARSRSGGIVGLVGAAVALALYPILLTAVPALRAQVNLLFLGLAIPVIIATSILVLFDPRPVLRECLLALPSLVCPAVVTWLYVQRPAGVTDLYLTGMILLMLFPTVTIQLRFALAAPVAAGIIALFAFGVHATPGIDANGREGLDVIGAVCCGYTLLANWRINTAQQYAYVLTLRERLRRRVLSHENRELDELARRDALTGLANRRAYDAWLAAAWQRAASEGKPLGLIVVDVDHFKLYNDFYGHPAGDVCLQTVAKCLRDEMRDTTDLVARIGGEEFAMILPAVSLRTCGDIAERLRRAIASLELPHFGVATDGLLSISLGAASLTPHPAQSPRDLTAAADRALYAAKQGGRDCVYLAGVEPSDILLATAQRLVPD